MKVDNITPHPLNKDLYELTDIDELMVSINQLGLLEPIIVSHKGYIISGHRRYEACKRLGLTEVDTRVIDVNEEDEELLLVEYNRQRVKNASTILKEYKVLEKFGKKNDKVGKVVDGIKKYSRDLIADKIGQTSGQMARLLYIDKHESEMVKLIDKGILTINSAYLETQRRVKENKSVEPRQEIDTTNLDKTWRVYIQSSSNMNQLKDGEVQTCICSPPYYAKRVYQKTDKVGLGNESTSQEYVDNLVSHLGDVYRVLNDTSSFFLNLGDTFVDGDLQNIPHRVVLGLKEEYGWIQRNSITWVKTNPKPSSSKSNLTPSTEMIFHLVKSKDYYYNQVLTKHSSTPKPSQAPRHRGIDSKVKVSTPYIPREGKNLNDYWTDDVVKTAVANQKLNLKSGLEHPAPYPKELIILPILQTSRENDLVLDPFMGSGTTLKVASELGRRVVGYDIQNYLE